MSWSSRAGERQASLRMAQSLWPLFVPSLVCQNGRMGESESCCQSAQARCSWLRRGLLKGLTAGTHPNFIGKLQEICNQQGAEVESTKVVDKRYVVNRVDERGLRVITSGGISCGLDAALWLVEDVAGQTAKEQVGHYTQYAWRKGFVVGE